MNKWVLTLTRASVCTCSILVPSSGGRAAHTRQKKSVKMEPFLTIGGGTHCIRSSPANWRHRGKRGGGNIEENRLPLVVIKVLMGVNARCPQNEDME